MSEKKSENKDDQLMMASSESDPLSSAPNTLKARELLYAYHNQVLSGCGDSSCCNPDCASSGKSMETKEANASAALALKLLKLKAPLCPAYPLETNRMDGFAPKRDLILTERRIAEKIGNARNSNEGQGLGSWLQEAVSNPETLSFSFPLSRSKSDDQTVDTAEASRSWATLFPPATSPPYLQAFIDGINQLCMSADLQIRHAKTEAATEWFYRIALILIELPILQDLEFQDAFQNLLRLLSLLPLNRSGDLVKIWSEKSEEWLLERVHAIQQAITIHVLKSDYEGVRKIQDDSKLTSCVKALELFYLAALIGGERDTDEELKLEVEFYTDSVLDTELGNQERRGQPRGRGAAEMVELLSRREEGNSNDSDAREDLASFLSVRPLDIRCPRIPFNEFYNETLCESLETDRDFVNYKAQKKDRFSYLNYPFILLPHIKMEGLFYENRISMYARRRLELVTSMFSGIIQDPFLKLHVSRTHPVRDALGQLNLIMNEAPEDLRKQLRVEFDGEQGIDEGGPSKEFYQLITEELFNPDYGMFVYSEETRLYWFNPHCLENDQEFMLIGVLFGLAIYNNIIVDVHFPLVLYRKVLGKVGKFPDLEQLDPVLYRGLVSLLEHEGNDVEDVFCHTFCISYKDVFGTELREDLKENGSQIPVTAANRREFVDLYADFLLNKSVKAQFSAFRRGFQMVVQESSLDRFFRPDEVEQLICGIAHFDFNTLEENTSYDGGYERTHPTIEYFWEVAHGMTEEEKRLLLQFTTGSDRVPVGGLSKLRFIIAKNGEDSSRLPTAHTCFNVLLLPEYGSKEKLKERLTKAILNSRGFGLR